MADNEKTDPSDEVNPDEVNPDEAKTDEAKADDTKADDTKADDTKADDTKADDTKADDTKADDAETDDAETDDDRRREPRHLACFPAYIEDGGVTRSAIIRDLSITGARLLTRARPEVGDRVRLSLYITPDPEEPGIVVGSVVRAEPWGEGHTIWSTNVGVQFDEPAAQYEKNIKELAEKQAKLGLFNNLEPSQKKS